PAKAYYKGPPYHLILMKSGNFPHRNWRSEYKDWLPEKQAYQTIVYRNYHTHCKFTFTLLEPSSDKP
ncbi:MAG: hypothetical protein IKS92_10980, partial [Victivallales bacterium]|nr:hypothetical protein [Victivallales bacterium]